MHRFIAFTAIGLISALHGSSATMASLSQSTISSPGGFVQAGAYDLTAGALVPGRDQAAGYGTGQDYHEQAFAGVASSQASASFSNGTITNSAAANADMGRIRASASNQFPSQAPFPAGITNGGWKETFTVNHPQLNGQSGFVVFQIRARGTMHASGVAGSCAIIINGYKDQSELMWYGLYDRGDSDPISTDRQRAQWGVSSFGQPESRTVDGIVTMAAPIVFGQPFTLGVYAMSFAGQRASGGFDLFSTSILDFSGEGI